MALPACLTIYVHAYHSHLSPIILSFYNVCSQKSYLSSQFECCGVDNYTDWIENNPYAIDGNTGIPPARCFCDVNQDNCEAQLMVEYVVNTNMTRTGPMTNLWDRVR